MDNSLAINTILLKAGNRIKSSFGSKTEFVNFFSDMADHAYNFRTSFQYIRKNGDMDIDFHFDALMIMREIHAAWDADDLILAKAMEELLAFGGPEHFYHTVCRALAIESWDNTAHGHSPMQITAMMENFTALFDIAAIFYNVQQLKDNVSKKAA